MGVRVEGRVKTFISTPFVVIPLVFAKLAYKKTMRPILYAIAYLFVKDIFHVKPLDIVVMLSFAFILLICEFIVFIFEFTELICELAVPI